METTLKTKKKRSLGKKILYGFLLFFGIIILIGILFPIDYYKEGVDYYNKQDYKKAYEYLSNVKPDDKNYNDAIAKIQEIKPLLDMQKDEEFKANVLTASTKELANAEEKRVNDSIQKVQDALELKQRQEEKVILEKLKAKAKRDWPNDYTTQEFWINEQIEAYKYMLAIPDNAIKRKAQKDWPLDFSTQKFWYYEQIEAKERLGH